MAYTPPTYNDIPFSWNGEPTYSAPELVGEIAFSWAESVGNIGTIEPASESVTGVATVHIYAIATIFHQPAVVSGSGIVQQAFIDVRQPVIKIEATATSTFALANISPTVESLSGSAESDLGQSAGSVSARRDKIKATGVSSAVICTVRPVRDGVIATSLNNIVCWGRVTPVRESVASGGVGHIFYAGRYAPPVSRVSALGAATAIGRGKISERQSIAATTATTALIIGKAAVAPKVCVVGASSLASVLCSGHIAYRLVVISGEAFVVPSCSAMITPRKDSVSIATTIFRQSGISYTRDKVMFPTAAAPTLAPLSFGRDNKTSASFGAPAPEVIFEFERT